MILGIVGSESAKFTPHTEGIARTLIRYLINTSGSEVIVCSGHCPLGGVDIWAEEIAEELGKPLLIFPPKTRSWETGYKPRNLEIAEASDEVHVITLRELPPGYTGMKFPLCYHCRGRIGGHTKSGACWTAIQAERMGKRAAWHIIGNDTITTEETL